MSELCDLLDVQESNTITPYEYQYWTGLKTKRRILFPIDIEPDTFASEVLIPLRDMDDGSGKPIEILIDCNGGDVVSMFAFIDLLDHIQTPVRVRVLTKAMSAALLSLLAGKNNPNVKVSCPQHAVGLLHGGSIGLGLMNNDQAKDVMKFYSKYDAMIKELVTSRTTIDSKQYTKMSKQENYMFGDELLKYGFVDEIEGA